MIPPVVASGARVIAPDLIGFGKSDKPTETSDYTYARHVAWMSEWFEQMNLSDVVLVCQDWGGLLGLRLVATYPDRFAGVVAANTFLPIGNGKPSEVFKNWRDFSQNVPEFPTGKIIQGATVRELTPDEVAAYDAPFPDESYKAGARIFPALVPTALDDPENDANRAAWNTLAAFDKPFVTAFSDQDPITKGGDAAFQERVAGTKGQPHQTLKGGGHFLQEDVAEDLAGVVVDLLARL
jgi:haloalkane dehalogenase